MAFGFMPALYQARLQAVTREKMGKSVKEVANALK
jgi:hypothetical protein